MMSSKFVLLTLVLVLFLFAVVACKPSKTVQLANGSQYEITGTSFVDNYEVSGETHTPQKGYIFLKIEFNRISSKPLSFEVDIWHVHVTDSQNNQYKCEGYSYSFVSESAYLLFEVPSVSHGFTLYFLDNAPIKLDV